MTNVSSRRLRELESQLALEQREYAFHAATFERRLNLVKDSRSLIDQRQLLKKERAKHSGNQFKRILAELKQAQADASATKQRTMKLLKFVGDTIKLYEDEEGVNLGQGTPLRADNAGCQAPAREKVLKLEGVGLTSLPLPRNGELLSLSQSSSRASSVSSARRIKKQASAAAQKDEVSSCQDPPKEKKTTSACHQPDRRTPNDAVELSSNTQARRTWNRSSSRQGSPHDVALVSDQARSKCEASLRQEFNAQMAAFGTRHSTPTNLTVPRLVSTNKNSSHEAVADILEIEKRKTGGVRAKEFDVKPYTATVLRLYDLEDKSDGTKWASVVESEESRRLQETQKLLEKIPSLFEQEMEKTKHADAQEKMPRKKGSVKFREVDVRSGVEDIPDKTEASSEFVRNEFQIQREILEEKRAELSRMSSAEKAVVLTTITNTMFLWDDNPVRFSSWQNYQVDILFGVINAAKRSQIELFETLDKENGISRPLACCGAVCELIMAYPAEKIVPLTFVTECLVPAGSTELIQNGAADIRLALHQDVDTLQFWKTLVHHVVSIIDQRLTTAEDAACVFTDIFLRNLWMENMSPRGMQEAHDNLRKYLRSVFKGRTDERPGALPLSHNGRWKQTKSAETTRKGARHDFKHTTLGEANLKLLKCKLLENSGQIDNGGSRKPAKCFKTGVISSVGNLMFFPVKLWRRRAQAKALREQTSITYPTTSVD